MKILTDGVFFSLAESGIARVWRSVLPLLAERDDFEIIMLDRGGAPSVPGVKRLPFASYKDFYTADDSILIQRVCDYVEADVFLSTYYTTPLSTPSVLIVHDMIPEVLGFNLNDRHWQEKAVAISYAARLLAVSENTRQDLIKFYPECEQQIAVAHCGYDRDIFKPLTAKAVSAFCDQYSIEKPYMLLVGSREQHLGYKNARMFFRALSLIENPDFDVICVGGEEVIEAESLALVPSGMKATRLQLSDTELALAYNGAEALVYPSLYEGFGLPVVEAMGCGCPVITTSHGSLREVAGDATIIIDGLSLSGMAKALQDVRKIETRSALQRAGIKQSARFAWEEMAGRIAQAIHEVGDLAADPDYQNFARRWREMREMQAEVDVDTWKA